MIKPKKRKIQIEISILILLKRILKREKQQLEEKAFLKIHGKGIIYQFQQLIALRSNVHVIQLSSSGEEFEFRPQRSHMLELVGETCSGFAFCIFGRSCSRTSLSAFEASWSSSELKIYM